MDSRKWPSTPGGVPIFCPKPSPRILLQIPYIRILIWIPERTRLVGFLQKIKMIDHDFCKKSGPRILLQIQYIRILIWIPERRWRGPILLQIQYIWIVEQIEGGPRYRSQSAGF